jgi:hypothetical protein
MESNLIEFDDLLLSPMQSKWEIENNERIQLIEFIETKIMTQVKHIIAEKDRQICYLIENQKRMQVHIDNMHYETNKNELSIEWANLNITGRNFKFKGLIPRDKAGNIIIQETITKECYEELNGLMLLVGIKTGANIYSHSVRNSRGDRHDKELDKKTDDLKQYLKYDYETLILPLPISINKYITFEDAMKIKEDIEKLGGIVQFV